MLNLAKNSLMVALTICLWNASDCFAQDRMTKLLTKEGQLISEGTNTTPVGELKATTYRLELVSPTSSSEGQNPNPQNKLFRLTITSAEKLLGSYRISIDDHSYPAFNLGLYKIGIVLHSRGLPNGAKLAVSLLEAPDGRYASTNVSVLPERLFVPSPYDDDPDNIGDVIRYSLRRVSRFVRPLDRQVPGVEIRVPSETVYHVGANSWFLQIGERDYAASASGKLLTAWFTDEEFSLLNEGDPMRVKYGDSPLVNGRFIGQLNKTVP